VRRWEAIGEMGFDAGTFSRSLISFKEVQLQINAVLLYQGSTVARKVVAWVLVVRLPSLRFECVLMECPTGDWGNVLHQWDEWTCPIVVDIAVGVEDCY
jgi:hypothetical protein